MRSSVVFSLLILYVLIDVAFSDVRCLGHTCHPGHHGTYCNLWIDKHGRLEGWCDKHNRIKCPYERYMPRFRECVCDDDACVQNVVNAARAGHPPTIDCISDTCDHRESCRLHSDSSGLTSRCELPPHHYYWCSSYSTLQSTCYCPTSSCVTDMQKLHSDHHKILHCGDQICNELYPVCELEKDKSRQHIAGSCHTAHERFCKDREYLTGSATTCRCLTQDCIDLVFKKHAEHLHDYQCLNLKCTEKQTCQLYTFVINGETTVTSKCSNQTGNAIPCSNHDSILGQYGCHCNSSSCVRKTGIHYKTLICHADQVMEVAVVNGVSKTLCLKGTHDKPPYCAIPFIPGSSHQPCICSTQNCADNIHDHIKPLHTQQPPSSETTIGHSIGSTLPPHSDYLQCINHKCSHDSPVCLLFKAKFHLSGTCHKNRLHPCEDYNYLTGSHVSCDCTTSECVHNVVRNSHYNYTGYMCLDQLCFPGHVCHLYRLLSHDGSHQERTIKGKCVFKSEQSANCINHDSVIHSSGCYCDSANCIRSIGIHHKTTICPLTEGLKISKGVHGTYYSACQEGSHNLPKCDQPLNLSSSHLPCFCATQDCADNLIYHATTAKPTQPTTLKTTTTVQPTNTAQTTTPVSTTACHVCGDSDIGIPCSAQKLHEDEDSKVACRRGYDYCMTDILQDNHGNLDVFKRCVDQATCTQKWVVESSVNDYCTNFTLGGHTPFECHFCCIGDGCNSHIVPEQSTWFNTTG